MRFPLPRPTVRLRLTLLYGALFVLSGAALIALSYGFAASRVGAEKTGRPLFSAMASQATPRIAAPGAVGGPSQASATPGAAVTVYAIQRNALHQFVAQSGIALALMVGVALVLGWMMAGRVLRPLRTMTAATRRISERNLGARLAIGGPRDEIRDLADTIDALLGRLEGAFEAERRFVANASHELRTPLTLSRALLEVALADPDARNEALRWTCERVLAAQEDQERLIEALLMLARSQRGLECRDPLDLAAIARDAVETHEAEAAARDVGLDATLAPAPMAGDRRLVARLVANLLQNAIRYNVPGGRVEVGVQRRGAASVLRVANSGQRVPADQVGRLLRPFQRLEAARRTRRDGLGLGLSIVAAIAEAHGGTVRVQAREEGGLEAEVTIPATAEEAAALDGARAQRRATGGSSSLPLTPGKSLGG